MTKVAVRVLRLINGLQQGGAEESLRKLVSATSGAGIESLVVNIGVPGGLRDDIERAGARVVEIELSRIPSPAKLVGLSVGIEPLGLMRINLPKRFASDCALLPLAFSPTAT